MEAFILQRAATTIIYSSLLSGFADCEPLQRKKLLSSPMKQAQNDATFMELLLSGICARSFAALTSSVDAKAAGNGRLVAQVLLDSGEDAAPACNLQRPIILSCL